jgi:hypothetical protein
VPRTKSKGASEALCSVRVALYRPSPVDARSFSRFGFFLSLSLSAMFSWTAKLSALFARSLARSQEAYRFPNQAVALVSLRSPLIARLFRWKQIIRFFLQFDRTKSDQDSLLF